MTTSGTPDKAWFIKQIESAGLNSRKVSAMLGLTPSLFSKRLSGGIVFTAAECADLARILKRPIDDVLRRAGIAVATASTQKAPVDGIASQDGAVRALGRSGPRSIDIPAGLGPLHAVIVSGGPFDGWAALYAPSSGIEPEAVGALAVAATADGKTLLGRFSKGRERGKWSVATMGGELIGDEIIATTASAVQWIRP